MSDRQADSGKDRGVDRQTNRQQGRQTVRLADWQEKRAKRQKVILIITKSLTVEI